MALATTTRNALRITNASYLAALAKQAMIAEAELTPKPGLADRRGSGAHMDLSLELMKRSAEAIEPYLALMADASSRSELTEELRAELGGIGRAAESAMYVATGGTNTHRGAIWALGLLVAAVNHSDEFQPVEIARVAGTIARMPDQVGTALVSHGDVVRGTYGVTGARGEAWANFPHVIEVGIPELRAARAAGKSESASRLSVLLSIMARLDDTCVFYRSGLDGSELVKTGAEAVLVAGGPESKAGDAVLWLFDQQLRAKHISPGGSADLLAATLFLDSLVSGVNRIEGDQSLQEEPYGEN
jgi:triphosphoribosyl-dephospho-CoA synthase